jgi:hypothetical protein
MWFVQEVRRHRVVPSLELPHHGGVPAVPVLLEAPLGRLLDLRLLAHRDLRGPCAKHRDDNEE